MVSRNLVIFKSVEYLLAGASERDYLDNLGRELYGELHYVGFGRTMRQARMNAKITKEVGNTDLWPVLCDTVFIKNGHLIKREEYSDKCYDNTGRLK